MDRLLVGVVDITTTPRYREALRQLGAAFPNYARRATGSANGLMYQGGAAAVMQSRCDMHQAPPQNSPLPTDVSSCTVVR